MKIIISITFLVFLVAGLIYWRIDSVERNEKEKRKLETVGVYEIDFVNSKLGKYENDSSTIRTLKLFLNHDMTFYFNHDFPFLYDSIGTWRVAETGIYGNNELSYKKNKNM